MNLSEKKCLVIGASSGIGACIARQLASNGCSVALVSRRMSDLQTMADDINRIAGRTLAHIYRADVTDFDAAPGLVEQIATDLGGLDIVVYSAGVMPAVKTSEYDFAKDKNIVDINVLGAIAWLNPVAERFERMKAGVIVGLGSVAGDRGRRGYPVYNASKAFVETYMEALRNRLGRFGVQVITVKPGFIRTPMTEGVTMPFPAGTPEKTAADILSAIEDGATVLYTPGWWRWIMLIIKLIPSPVMQRLSF